MVIHDWAIDYCIIKRPYENFGVSNGVIVADGRSLVWETLVDGFFLSLLHPILFILAEYIAPFIAPILYRNMQILAQQCPLYLDDASFCFLFKFIDKKTCTMVIAACLQTFYGQWVYCCSYGGGNKSTAKWNWIGLLLYFNLSLWFQTVDTTARIPILGAFSIFGISVFFNTLYNLSFQNQDTHMAFQQAVEYCRINSSADNVDAYWREWRNLTYKTQLQTTHSFLVDWDGHDKEEETAEMLFRRYIQG